MISGSESAITGIVVSAAVIAYGSDNIDSVGHLTAAILGTVAVYWLAHLHAVTLSSAITHRQHPLAAFRLALRETLPILGACVVPVVVLLVSSLLGADLRTAAWTAMVAAILLLTGYGYVAGVRGGLGTGGRIASAAAGAALGVLVALLKVWLH
jgi:hypothetical protein